MCAVLAETSPQQGAKRTVVFDDEDTHFFDSYDAERLGPHGAHFRRWTQSPLESEKTTQTSFVDSSIPTV